VNKFPGRAQGIPCSVFLTEAADKTGARFGWYRARGGAR
jgi:hypothetical protein